MKKLLIDESPLILLPTLAEMIGINEAIILQQLHYWIMHTGPDGRKYGKQLGDRRWIRNSVESWQESNFPFLTTHKIYRALAALEKAQLIDSRKDLNKMGYDRTKWYTVNYTILHQREMEFAKEQDRFRASEETIPETTSEKTTEEEVHPASSWNQNSVIGFVQEVCGLLLQVDINRAGNIKNMVLLHGEEKTKAAFQEALSGWKSKKNQNTHQYYTVYNPGWIDWGIEYLTDNVKRWETNEKLISGEDKIQAALYG